MNYIERSQEKRKCDICKAMNYSYRKRRMRSHLFNSFVQRVFVGSILFFIFVFVLALLFGAF